VRRDAVQQTFYTFVGATILFGLVGALVTSRPQ
jgi:hypothetical protein